MSIKKLLNAFLSTPQLESVEHDAQACFHSFKHHWQQASEMMTNSEPLVGVTPKISLPDSISGVLNHFDQMLMLLLHDLRKTEQYIGPLLDLVLTENILDKLLTWSLKTNEYANTLILEQMKLYEMLITQSHQEVLVHKPVLQPLMKLLSTCGERPSIEVDKRLVILLNQLCVSLTRSDTLLELLFNTTCNQGPAKFLIFSLLIPFVHREGSIGQQARDALLLCMSLSYKNENIGIYIAQHSTVCPVLAAGLSGLYSRLPRAIVFTEDWHRFTTDDISDLPDLVMFLNSLEFCNAVIQVSHPLVQEQLLEYLKHGFLIPVMVPALRPESQQSSIEELATAIAYLELILRTVTEPSLIRTILQVLLSESNGRPLLENIVLRIANQQPLSLVSMSLFRTLLDLNCEDIMFELIFKYLIPCNHIMVSQRCRVQDTDMFCTSAEKFLSLVPSCCLLFVGDEGAEDKSHQEAEFSGMQSTSSSVLKLMRQNSGSSDVVKEAGFGQNGNGASVHAAINFLEYLFDARRDVLSCYLACCNWTWPYDGNLPANISEGSEVQSEPNKLFQNGEDKRRFDAILSTNDTLIADRVLPGASNSNAAKDSKTRGGSLDNVNRAVAQLSQSKYVSENENRKRLVNSVKLTHLLSSPIDCLGTPDLGPFLSILMSKLENMMNNTVYENLQLTGLFARLACYPQPLLRSFLLNHSLVFQPSVRSLIQVLGTLKHKLDTCFYTVDGVMQLLDRARKFLAFRDEKFWNNGIVKMPLKGELSGDPFSKEMKRRRIFSELFSKKSFFGAEREKGYGRTHFLDDLPNDAGYRYVKSSTETSSEGTLESMRSRNAVLCMVVFEEFLLELSAIAMEHAVLLTNDYLDD
ncbi:hypothetical protein CHUAL_008627 [Chamberlinius hualienensis]